MYNNGCICAYFFWFQRVPTTTVRDAMGLSDKQNQLVPEKQKEGKIIYISRQPASNTKEQLNINGVTEYMGYWRISVETRSSDVSVLLRGY